MVAPADWKEIKVGDYARITTGKKNTQDRIADGKYPFFVRSQNVERINSYSYDGEAVLTAGDGVGTGKVFHYINGKFDCHQRVYRITDFRSDLNGKFFYLLFSRLFYDRIMSMTAKSSVDSVRMEMISEMELIVPSSIREQELIAEALSDADTAIESLDALIVKKRDVKQAAMQQLLTGRTRLPGFTADWTEARLGEHASMRSGGTPLTSVASFYGGTIPWASISDMSASGKYLGATDRYITEAGLASSPAVVFPEGVLLYAMYASIGECCISVCPMATSQAILGIKCANDLSLEFLYYTMQSKRAEIARSGQQGTQANLNAQMVRETMFLMPPLKEQEAIAEVLSAMDDELEALTGQVSKLRMVKEGMMQDLLTGKVRLV